MVKYAFQVFIPFEKVDNLESELKTDNNNIVVLKPQKRPKSIKEKCEIRIRCEIRTKEHERIIKCIIESNEGSITRESPLTVMTKKEKVHYFYHSIKKVGITTFLGSVGSTMLYDWQKIYDSIISKQLDVIGIFLFICIVSIIPFIASTIADYKQSN